MTQSMYQLPGMGATLDTKVITPASALAHIEPVVPVFDHTIVVNFVGAPGAGKSTHGMKLTAFMKEKEMNVELVTEYAKDIVWRGTHVMLEDQLYVFAKQQERMNRLLGKVDVIVTDSPLILSQYYNGKSCRYLKNLPPLIEEVYQSYDNIVFFVERDKKYNPMGRLQTEAESDIISSELRAFMDAHGIRYKPIKSTTTSSEIYKDVVKYGSKKTSKA